MDSEARRKAAKLQRERDKERNRQVKENDPAERLRRARRKHISNGLDREPDTGSHQSVSMGKARRNKQKHLPN